MNVIIGAREMYNVNFFLSLLGFEKLEGPSVKFYKWRLQNNELILCCSLYCLARCSIRHTITVGACLTINIYGTCLTQTKGAVYLSQF
jgi:hypothetical protein